MAEEFENKEVQSEQNENSREGYSAAGQGSYQREYRGTTGRTQRPRIHSQRAYSSNKTNNGNDEGGFRPEGFGSGLQSTNRPQQGGYRPRQNSYGGYNNRGGYQNRPQQGATGHATTTTVTKAATSHGRADITTAVAIRTARSREVTVLVTTTTKTVTSNSLTAHATMPETVLRARKTMAIRQTREVISRGTEVTSHAAATRTAAITTTGEVTIMEAIRTGEVTTTVAATRTAAATIRAVIASVQLIMTRMLNTRSRSGLSTRRRTSTRMSRSA